MICLPILAAVFFSDVKWAPNFFWSEHFEYCSLISVLIFLPLAAHSSPSLLSLNIWPPLLSCIHYFKLIRASGKRKSCCGSLLPRFLFDHRTTLTLKFMLLLLSVVLGFGYFGSCDCFHFLEISYYIK